MDSRPNNETLLRAVAERDMDTFAHSTNTSLGGIVATLAMIPVATALLAVCGNS